MAAMPWEKQFNTDDVLTKAMNAFWAKGYESTSMQDLVSCMGINRGSLYATFGDKRDLFIQALRHYDETHRAATVAALRKLGSPRQAIMAVFAGAIAAAIDQGSRDGCLLINTALELSPHDEEIAAFVSDCLTDMENFFRDMVKQAVARGEVSPDIDPVDTARGLLSLHVGLRVLARSRPEESLLRSIEHQAETLLR
jgi:TetR/AcrR family transcriptional repressor of nem operon